MPQDIGFRPQSLTQTDLGTALSLGRLVCTYTGNQDGHITLQFRTWKRGDRRRRVPVYDADRIYIDVPSPHGYQFNDKIGNIDLRTGNLWVERNADPARVEAAKVVLLAAQGGDETNILRPEYCMVCGRELTHPESIQIRIGPECAKRAYSDEHQEKVKGQKWEGPIHTKGGEKVEVPEVVEIPEVHIRAAANGFEIDFQSKFSRDALDVMKDSTRGRSYDGYTKVWTVESTGPNAAGLLKLADAYELTVDPIAREQIEALADVPELRIDLDGDSNFDVRFDFGPNFDAILNGVKEITTGRKWNPAEKYWSVTATPKAAIELRRLAGAYKTRITDDAQTSLTELVGQADESERNADTLYELSRAEEAEIDGLDGFGWEPYPFQRAGILYVDKANGRTLIADEQGLGKTIQALGAIYRNESYPAIIVCPSNVKVKWTRACKRAFPEKNVVMLAGREPYKFEADVVVINYDILSNWSGRLITMNPQALVLDESHYVKGHKSQRTIAAQAIAHKIPNDGLVLELTGTPVLNKPIELVQQLDILGRLDEFGGFGGFIDRYVGWDDGNTYATKRVPDPYGAKNLTELNEKLRRISYVRRLKKDVLPDLPEKQRDVVPLEVSDEYARELRGVRERLKGSSGYAEHLAEITLLRQAAARSKLKGVIEWTHDFLETGEKLVLFAYHQEIQKALIEEFPDAARILGSKLQSKKKRQENMDRFQEDEDCKLVICSLESAKEGIDLYAASNLAFVELGWNPGTHNQAEDRIHRIGQDRGTTMYYLLAEGTIDEEISRLIEWKRERVDAATEGGEVSNEPDREMVGSLVEWLTAAE